MSTSTEKKRVRRRKGRARFFLTFEISRVLCHVAAKRRVRRGEGKKGRKERGGSFLPPLRRAAGRGRRRGGGGVLSLSLCSAGAGREKGI